MKLSNFLEKAGLNGKKLEVAMKACDDNMLETVQELRELDKEHLEKVFPQAIIHDANDMDGVSQTVRLRSMAGCYETLRTAREAGALRIRQRL